MLARNTIVPERHRMLRILVVDPSVDDSKRIRDLLQEQGEFVTHVARSSDEARALLSNGLFDVALIDAGMWNERETDLIRLVREEHSDVAIVLLTSGDNDRETLPGFKLGAHDFLNRQHLQDKDQLATRLLAAFEESRAMRRRDTMVRWLEREARTDHMTGLYNRRAFDDRLREVCDAARLSDEPITLIVVDVAGTRTVNEAHGHEAGDDMIRRAAAGITRSLRGCDFAARVGGDDFGVILPNSDMEFGRLIARRISHKIDRLNIEDWANQLPVSLTFGVATGKHCQPADLFNAADQQLSPYKTARPVITLWREQEESDGPDVA
jgi:two-component system, cell cycle response regulator